MPMYTYVCRECGEVRQPTMTITKYTRLQEAQAEFWCVCGEPMVRDWKHDNVRVGAVPGTGNPRFVRELEDRAKRVTATPDDEVRRSIETVYGPNSRELNEWDHGKPSREF